MNSRSSPGGKLPGPISDAIRSILRGSVGRRLRVTIGEIEKIRTLKQNAYWWSCVIPPIQERLFQEGNTFTPTQVHEVIRQTIAGHIFARMVHMPDKTWAQFFRSSTELTTTEWNLLLEIVWAWADSNGIEIQRPNEHLVIEHETAKTKGGDDGAGD